MFIQIKNLKKKFKNNFAVNGINFEIDKDRTLGLLGPNGCGKTTSNKISYIRVQTCSGFV